MVPKEEDINVFVSNQGRDSSAYFGRDGEKEASATTVPLKYRGTSADQRDMSVLGKEQVLRRNFKFATMLGFACTVTATWEILLPLFTFVLTDGGTPILFWGFIGSTCGMVLVYASLAEMASISPTSGGQYHWVSEFSPPKVQKSLSYLTGWLCGVGWQVYLAGVCFMIGSIIQGLIALNVKDYVWQNWHGTLLTIAVISFAIIFNTILATRLPLLEGMALALHLVSFFAVIIPLWVMAPRRTSSDALLNFTNDGGWSSKGLSAMIGLTTPMSVLIGYDCSVHMSEEVNDASATLPKAIMWSIGPNAGLGFIMAITLCFTLGDINSILGSVTGEPFIQVFYNATRSYAGTNVMCATIIILLCSCCVSELATASRQIWSFARDKGLPGSNWLVKVTPGWNVPIRAVFVSFLVSSLLSLINLRSYTALNAIKSLGGVAILSTYFVTISSLVWRRLFGPPLPPTPFTAEGMNWASVMFGGVLTIAMAWYLSKGRHVYTGPLMLVKRDE